MLLDKLIESKIQVYAFVGPSGTGKSYRAQMVASEYNIRYIIDDGLLIKDNEVIAGESAKKAPTKIETVKEALFIDNSQAEEIKKALRKNKPESLLILGTSDGMIEKIRTNLELPELTKTIYITDVATDQEMEEAKRMRQVEGKHVIPVPTFEIKKDFSGYLLDPLQIFKSKGKDAKPYISEKSIIRPTFSYLGNYTISDGVYIYYNGGPDIIGKDLFPTDNRARDGVVKEITVRVDEYKEDAKFNLYLDLKTLPNALKHASFKYELYQASTLKTSGNFTNSGVTCTTNSTKHIVLLSNVTPSTTTVTYTLYIWIDGVNFTNPDTMMNQEFEFTLHADGVKVKEKTFADMTGQTAVLDTTAGVDFSKTSVQNGTNGLYILSSTQNDSNPIYYYRGNVDNNYVMFGNRLFRVIRVYNDNSVK